MSETCEIGNKKSDTNIESIFTEDSCHQKWCVRRVGGLIGLCTVVVCIFLRIEHGCLQPLLYLSFSLIGLTTVDKFIK